MATRYAAPQRARYQHPAAASVDVPAPAVDDPFFVNIRRLAARLLASVDGLSKSERRFLHDLGRREEVRYSMTSARRLARIARASSRPEDRLAFAELWRGESAGALPVVERADAWDKETAATGAADLAQRAYERHPTPENRQAVIDALERQAAWTMLSIDVVREEAR